MKADEIPKDVREFIREHVQSVSQLETLICLAKNRERSWTVEKLTKELRSNQAMIEKNISHWKNLELVTTHPDFNPSQYVFSVKDAAMSDKVDRLIQSVSLYPLRIIQLICDQQSERIMQFAEAFKIKKGENDG
jgi:hypothetical protein